MIRVVGDVRKAFSVELDYSLEEWERLTGDMRDAAVAAELRLQRFGREEAIDIDFVEPVE